MANTPDIKARSLYAQEYAKKAKTIHQSKDAMAHAYGAVEKKHGKDVSDKLKAYHDKNASDDEDFDAFSHLKKAKGGKISTAEHGNPKHKHCW